MPNSIFFINKISAYIQANLLLAAMRYLGDMNINVRSLTCDGTITNLKSYELLGCNFSLQNIKTYIEHHQKNLKCIVYWTSHDQASSKCFCGNQNQF